MHIINPLNAKLNPICHLLALLGAHHIFHVSGLRVKGKFVQFGVHVTVHHDKFLIIEPTRCTNFSKFYLEWKSTCFGQFLCPSSGVFHCTHSNTYRFADSLRTSCQQTCMTCTIAVCPVKNSWWWTKELSETCRVSFQIKFWDISASSWFYYKKMEKGLDCPQLKRCGRT
jgi:hypothetical protein